MEAMIPVLELHIPDRDDGTQFYRYAVGPFRVWFSQSDADGHIYCVSVASQDKDMPFELYVHDKTRDRFYPDCFQISGHCPTMDAEEASQYMAKMQIALDALAAIKTLFLTGRHYEAYCRQLVEDAFGSVRLGDYDLDGVEFTGDDTVTMTQRVMRGESAADVVHQYLLSIRETLDIGLDDMEEDMDGTH